MYSSIKEKHEKEKADYEHTVQKQHKDVIEDLQYADANNAKKLEQRLKEIEELEIAAEQMKHLIHELRVQVEQEKEKQTELMFSNRE